MRTILTAIAVNGLLAAICIANQVNIIEKADCPDDSAASQTWRALWGTAPARAGEVEGRRAILLPCNLAQTRIERASWDRTVKIDLSRAAAVEVDLFSRDLTPVSSLSLYFRSGGGWYSSHIKMPAPGKWTTVRVKKEEMRIEGSPAGWSKVDAIRLSAWRGGNRDAELALGGIRMVEAEGGLVIVRNESALVRNPKDEQSVREFPQSMSQQLARLGFECLIAGDQDLPNITFAKTDVILLPYAPNLAPAAEETLLKHIENGGKVVAFYQISGKLAAAVGVKKIGFQSGGRTGRFAQIRAAEAAPEGMPAITKQRSWNITRVAAVEQHPANPRPVAFWHDADGNPANEPAIILSDRGGFMTHVLLTDDRENQQKLLLSIVGKLNPEIWNVAGRRAVESLRARQAQLVTPDQAARIEKSPELKTLHARFTAAFEEVRGGAVARAQLLGRAADADRLLIELYARLQSSAPNEQRGFWVHSAFGPAGMGWDNAIKAMADNGLNAIFPNMLWGGVAYYKSDVLPVAPEVKEQGDQVELCLAACRKYGVKIHVWKVNWNMGWRFPKEFGQQMKSQGRTQVKFDGTPEDRWLCPSHPDNRKLEIDSMVEVAAKYPVDGIHFDYIRYPGDESCFCPGCRERFEKILGQKVDPWPAAIRKDPAIKQKWNDFRRDNITAVVQAVSEQTRKVRPQVQISAAVFSNWTIHRDSVAQDWKLWCEKGYIDFVCPMDYTPHDTEFEQLVRLQVEWAGKVPVYPGIGISCWPDKHDLVGLVEKIKIARAAGCRGFTVFEYQADLAPTVFPMLRAGATR